ncbi:MAG TPA: hypothetical protein VLD65_00485, partial [Anaerolineales bacterium]|nr:hypothetical protein [Anaerolineales bacterium]
ISHHLNIQQNVTKLTKMSERFPFSFLCYTYLNVASEPIHRGVPMFEHRRQPLLTPREFLIRQLMYLLVALGIIGGSLVLGMVGYHYFENLAWIDALLNAAMLLGGMGPVNELHTSAGKLFASFYALYSGIVFLVSVGVILAPLYHRFLHHFHLEMEDA